MFQSFNNDPNFRLGRGEKGVLILKFFFFFFFFWEGGGGGGGGGRKIIRLFKRRI